MENTSDEWRAVPVRLQYQLRTFGDVRSLSQHPLRSNFRAITQLRMVGLVIFQVLLIAANSRLNQNSLDDAAKQKIGEAMQKLSAISETEGSIDDSDIDRFIELLDVAAKESQDNNTSEIITLVKNVRQQTKSNNFNLEDFLKSVDFVINPSEKSSSKKRPDTLKGYKDQFKKIFGIPIIPLPEISKNFKEYLQFANMRVAGPNPLVIERMTEKDPRFPVTNKQYQAVMDPSDSIEQALDDGRLYLADYRVFEDALQGTYPQEQKYICAPLAMFAVPKEGIEKYLRPIAIQCFQEPGNDNPIFTPKDGNWLIAKTIVQIADANFHEAISHLGRTHLFIEPFVIATYRKLPENHVLRKLLLPHFEGTLFINWGADNLLARRKRRLDELLAPTIDASRVVATKGTQSYLFDFNGSMLKETLKRRGVDDAKKLPYYPYRDDAIKIWDAIQAWVKGYLESCYTNDTEVANDTDLQNWVQELLSHEGGRLKNFGNEDGKICTLDYLIEATTMIIFTASAQHAAVNFPQSKIMSYTPAMPLAGYSPAPTTTAGNGSEEDLIAFLPTLDTALSQLNLTYLLGSVYYTKLGYYPRNFKNDLSGDQETALDNFKDKLKEIEGNIKDRNNNNSDVAYEYLMPSKIPQSINI